MRVFPSLLLVGAVWFVSIFPLRILAQGAAAATGSYPVEVELVKFSSARSEAGDDWFETEIHLNIKPGGRAVSGEYVDGVRVHLSLGLKATRENGGERVLYYRSSAQLVTVEGGTALVRFYLPPEVLKRDKLRGDADYFLVELEAEGKALRLTSANLSKSIPPEFVASYRAKASSAAAAHDGILVPQYLTPFAFDARRPTPSFIRRESLR